MGSKSEKNKKMTEPHVQAERQMDIEEVVKETHVNRQTKERDRYRLRQKGKHVN